MKTIQYIIIFILFVSLTNNRINAQLSTNELPYSFVNTKQAFFNKSINDIEIKVLDLPVSIEELEKEDIRDDANGIPPRFGYPIPVKYDLESSGTWITLENGDRLWQLIICSPNATSINLLYDKFHIPEKAKFYIYSSDKVQHMGAFTSLNNKGNSIDIKGFATGLTFGDEIVLEYFLPAGVEEKGIISIAYVVHGYRFIDIPKVETKGYGTSGSCMINVNCPEGANWANEKNAIGLIFVNGHRWCTGALINNTGHNAEAYFLTANHCLNKPNNEQNVYDAISNPDLSQWSFIWNYETPGCTNPSSDPSFYTTSGAVLVANNSISDFALFRLLENPKDLRINGYYPVYLGWKRSNPTNGGASIHHPDRDVKKISIYNNTPSSDGNYWKVSSSYNAPFIMIGGSSGAPLLNSHAIIGQAYSISDNTFSCTNQNGYVKFGKFSVSWTGNNATDSRRRLKDWLDPTNTNPTSISRFPAAIGDIYGPSYLSTNETGVYYLNIPNGEVTWSTSPGLQIVSGQNTKQVTIKAVSGNGPIRINANFWGQSTHRDIDVNLKVARTITGPSTGIAGQTVYFRAEPMYEDGTYTWSVTNSNAYVAGSNKYDAQIQLNSAGNVTVECRYAPPGGTAQTVPATKAINIQNSYSVYARDGQIIITPIESVQKTSRTLTYSLIEQVTGKITERGNISTEGGIINYPHIVKGVYILKLESTDGFSEIYKIAL